MKIDMSQKMLTLKGKESDPPAWPSAMTLEECCYTALRTGLPDDQNASLKAKLELHKLAIKITTGGVVELSAAEIVQLQERVGRAFFSPEIVGVANAMLETEYKEPIIRAVPDPENVVAEMKADPRFKETTRQ